MWRLFIHELRSLSSSYLPRTFSSPFIGKTKRHRNESGEINEKNEAAINSFRLRFAFAPFTYYWQGTENSFIFRESFEVDCWMRNVSFVMRKNSFSPSPFPRSGCFSFTALSVVVGNSNSHNFWWCQLSNDEKGNEWMNGQVANESDSRRPLALVTGRSPLEPTSSVALSSSDKRDEKGNINHSKLNWESALDFGNALLARWTCILS